MSSVILPKILGDALMSGKPAEKGICVDYVFSLMGKHELLAKWKERIWNKMKWNTGTVSRASKCWSEAEQERW